MIGVIFFLLDIFIKKLTPFKPFEIYLERGIKDCITKKITSCSIFKKFVIIKIEKRLKIFDEILEKTLGRKVLPIIELF